MTRISDMSSTQRQAWLVLLADGAVFVWFWQKMTAGLSMKPIDYDMEQFGQIIFGLVVLTVILHIAISVTFEIVAKNSGGGRDERDVAIERRGAHWGYRVLQIGVGVVVVGMLMTAMFGEDYDAPILFQTPVQIIFVLVVISYVADLIKHGVMIHGYGR